MKLHEVETTRRLAPDADIFHAFSADESARWRRWLAAVPAAAVAGILNGIGAQPLVTFVALISAGVLAYVIGGPRRIVALDSNHALIFAARRVTLRSTADRLIDMADRGAVERSMTGPFNERWRFGDRSLVVPRSQGESVEAWRTANG